MLTLLTPTGCRPEAWALCQRWMARQTYRGPVRWVIVDDGKEAQPITFERKGWTLDVIRPAHRWEPGKNTQCDNFLAGLAVIGDDERVVVIEDDDHYHPEWLQAVSDHLRDVDLIGMGWNRYYNVRTGELTQHDNHRHASLCATAFKGDALKLFRDIVKQRPRLCDIRLWRRFEGKKALTRGTTYVVGMKAMPGRGGIASGHGLNGKANGNLADWIGDDAAHYAQFR